MEADKLCLYVNSIKACGLALLFAGLVLFTDSNRILISRVIGTSSQLSSLEHPIFYYVALGKCCSRFVAVVHCNIKCNILKQCNVTLRLYNVHLSSYVLFGILPYPTTKYNNYYYIIS